ncbi:leucine efflux protein LeuE [Gammaproteobacteria bacterium]|nr:leucine efflux protein LeuE [Gammaproteobacteria bacterium]
MADFGVISYLTYLVGCVLVILLPGPNSLYVLSLAAQQGIRVGWAAACGIFVGDAALMLATALGAVSVLNTYPAVFVVIKAAGAIYLAWIGLTMINGALSTWRSRHHRHHQHSRVLRQTSAHHAFKKALMISLLNPKAILFLLSFFVQFVDPAYPEPILPFLILALTLQACSAIYLATLIFAGDRLASGFRQRKRLSALSGAATGVAFILFAGKLAVASL